MDQTGNDLSPQYAGFWIRVAATLIDTLMISLLTTPILYGIYGDQYFNPDQVVAGSWDVIISWIMPSIAVILFWLYRAATPGKMLFKIEVADAKSLGPASLRQLLIRYLSYFISSLPMCAGFLWIAYDPRKQGWHDKLANTVVIRR